MPLPARVRLLILIACLPCSAHAELVRCTSPDGKASVLRRDKCDSPTDIQTPVSATKSIAKPSEPSAALGEGMLAHKSRDYPKALRLLTPLAEQGNPTAQVLLGDLYHFGHGVPKDDAAAYSWNRKAAEQGDPKGQSLLAVMYQEGWGTPKDDAQAIAWFRKAADQGYGLAQIALGFAYMNGRGVPKDNVKAMQWIRKAAEGGNPDAQALVGLAYREGEAGLPKDNAQARFWLGKAAAQGDANAMATLRQMGR